LGLPPQQQFFSSLPLSATSLDPTERDNNVIANWCNFNTVFTTATSNGSQQRWQPAAMAARSDGSPQRWQMATKKIIRFTDKSPYIRHRSAMDMILCVLSFYSLPIAMSDPEANSEGSRKRASALELGPRKKA